MSRGARTRARKNLLRQRLSWARLRTMLRNRIHALLNRQHCLELPQCSDNFGARGLGFLRRLELPEPDGTLLEEALALHTLIAQQMRAQEKRIAAEFKLQCLAADDSFHSRRALDSSIFAVGMSSYFRRTKRAPVTPPAK
jgi:hypothetical protein